MTETSATKPPQLRAARARKQSIIKFVILFVTLAFLFVPLLAMLIFTLRHPLSGRWSAAPWIAIFTGNGESLGADLTVLWQGIGTSLALSAVTVVIMLVLLVPTMVIVHIRSKVLERAIEWVATLPLTIPAIVLVVGLGPIYRWLSADVLNLQVALYQLGQSNSQISTAMSLLALLFGAVLLVALDLISDAMRKSREGK